MFSRPFAVFLPLAPLTVSERDRRSKKMRPLLPPVSLLSHTHSPSSSLPPSTHLRTVSPSVGPLWMDEHSTVYTICILSIGHNRQHSVGITIGYFIFPNSLNSCWSLPFHFNFHCLPSDASSVRNLPEYCLFIVRPSADFSTSFLGFMHFCNRLISWIRCHIDPRCLCVSVIREPLTSPFTCLISAPPPIFFVPRPLCSVTKCVLFSRVHSIFRDSPFSASPVSSTLSFPASRMYPLNSNWKSEQKETCPNFLLPPFRSLLSLSHVHFHFQKHSVLMETFPEPRCLSMTINGHGEPKDDSKGDGGIPPSLVRATENLPPIIGRDRRCEIYKFNSESPLYASAWSNKNHIKFRLAVGTVSDVAANPKAPNKVSLIWIHFSSKASSFAFSGFHCPAERWHFGTCRDRKLPCRVSSQCGRIHPGSGKPVPGSASHHFRLSSSLENPGKWWYPGRRCPDQLESEREC